MRYKVIRVTKGRIGYLTQKHRDLLLENHNLWELTTTLKDRISDSLKPKVVSLIDEVIKQALAETLKDQLNFLRNKVISYIRETCTIGHEYLTPLQKESKKTLNDQIVLLKHAVLEVINKRVSPQYLKERLRDPEESTTVILKQNEIDSLRSDIISVIEERIKCLETIIDHQQKSRELIDSLKSELDRFQSEVYRLP